MNRHDRRAQASAARRRDNGDPEHWVDCGCDHLGLFHCGGVCTVCGAREDTHCVLPTAARPGDVSIICWGPCHSCGEGEYIAEALCLEVRPW